MAGIKVPVDADVSALRKKIDDVGKQIEKINYTVNSKPGSKWQPVDVNDITQKVRDAEKVITAAQDRIQNRPAPAGTAGRPGRPGGGRSARDEDETRYGIRRRYTTPPDLGDVPRSLFSGFGGGFSQVAGAGTRGAMAGAAGGGGVTGALGGLLKGTAIGALAFGAFKAGQAVSDGVDMAADRAGSIDTLKRQMGDIGISFERLKIASDSAAYGLGVNSKEFATIEQRLNVASRGADKNPLDLADSASLTTGFARAYGMDPTASAGLFGAARNTDQRQSYRQLAGILAETIERSSMASRADEVMQAVVTFAQSTARLGLSTPNIGAFAGAYSGLINSGLPGMSSEAAAALLGQANSAMSNMGAAGEAGQAFTLAAFGHSGRSLNPLEAMAEASGGLFGSRSSVFGPNSAMRGLIGDSAANSLAGGPGSTTTNFDMIRAQAARITGNSTTGKELQAEMLQRYFGLGSIQQAAALMQLNGGQMQGLDGVLGKAGVNLKDVNYTNIATVARLGGARGMGSLDSVYADMRSRTGSSALSSDEIKGIDSARGKGEEEYRNALVRATASKDYAQDTFTVARDSKAALDTLQTTLGDKIYPAITGFRDDMIALMGGKNKLNQAHANDDIATGDFEYTAAQSKENMRYAAQGLRNEALAPDNPMDDRRWQAQAANEEQHRKALAEIEVNHDYAKKFAGQADALSLNAIPIQVHPHFTVHIDKNGNTTITQDSTSHSVSAPRAAGAQ